MKTETIELLVKVKINYNDAKGRKEAIKKAKECVMSSSILGSNSCVPKSAKVHIPEIRYINKNNTHII